MHKEAHVAAKATCAHHHIKAVCSSTTATFLLPGDVSARLSTSQLDLRGRQAEVTFAARLDWDKTRQASAHFGLSRNFFC